jgi:hypothetical protein
LLGEVGQTDGEIAAANEAVAISRGLTIREPDVFLPDLARCLDGLATALARPVSRDEELAAAQEAVTIWRTLAQTEPDAFLPDLARSLHNAASSLANAGHTGAALQSLDEAIAIRRQLAERHTAVHGAGLEDSQRLHDRLGSVGRSDRDA